MHFSARNGWRFVRIALGRTGRAIERSGRRAFSPSPRRPWRTVCFLSPRTETREHSPKWVGEKSGESRETRGKHVTRRDARARSLAHECARACSLAHLRRTHVFARRRPCVRRALARPCAQLHRALREIHRDCEILELLRCTMNVLM